MKYCGISAGWSVSGSVADRSSGMRVEQDLAAERGERPLIEDASAAEAAVQLLDRVAPAELEAEELLQREAGLDHVQRIEPVPLHQRGVELELHLGIDDPGDQLSDLLGEVVEGRDRDCDVVHSDDSTAANRMPLVAAEDHSTASTVQGKPLASR